MNGLNSRKDSNASSGESNSPLRSTNIARANNRGKQQSLSPNEPNDKLKRVEPNATTTNQFQYNKNQRRTSNTSIIGKPTNEPRQQLADANRMNPNNSLVPYQSPEVNKLMSNEINSTITTINTNEINKNDGIDDSENEKYDYVAANSKTIKPVIKRTLLNDFDFVNDDFTNNEQNFNSEAMRSHRDQPDNLSTATLNYAEPSQFANRDDINRWKIQRVNLPFFFPNNSSRSS